MTNKAAKDVVCGSNRTTELASTFRKNGFNRGWSRILSNIVVIPDEGSSKWQKF